jgi:hypothetical protein
MMAGIYEIHRSEMGSGVMIYIPSFIKIGSGIQKLVGEGIHRHNRELIFSFQNKESRLKMGYSRQN